MLQWNAPRTLTHERLQPQHVGRVEIGAEHDQPGELAPVDGEHVRRERVGVGGRRRHASRG